MQSRLSHPHSANSIVNGSASALLLPSFREVLHCNVHRGPTFNLLYDRTGERVVTGADDGCVKVISTRTGMLCQSLRGHVSDITDMDINASNTLLATCSSDCTVRLWWLSNGAQAATLSIGGNSGLGAVHFCEQPCSQDDLLVGVSMDGRICMWRMAPLYEVEAMHASLFLPIFVSIPPMTSFEFVDFACSQVADFVVIAGEVDHHRASVTIVQTAAAAEDQDLSAANSRIMYHSILNRKKIRTLCEAKHSASFASGSEDGGVDLWLRISSRDFQQIELRNEYYSNPTVTAIAWFDEDRSIAACFQDASIAVFSVESREVLWQFRTVHTNETYALYTHPWLTTILISASFDGTVAIWDLSPQKYEDEESSLVAHLHDSKNQNALYRDVAWAPSGLAFSVVDNEGNLIIYGGGEPLWGAQYLEQFLPLEFHNVAFDAKGIAVDVIRGCLPHLLFDDPLCDSEGREWAHQPASAWRKPAPHLTLSQDAMLRWRHERQVLAQLERERLRQCDADQARELERMRQARATTVRSHPSGTNSESRRSALTAARAAAVVQRSRNPMLPPRSESHHRLRILNDSSGEEENEDVLASRRAGEAEPSDLDLSVSETSLEFPEDWMTSDSSDYDPERPVRRSRYALRRHGRERNERSGTRRSSRTRQRQNQRPRRRLRSTQSSTHSPSLELLELPPIHRARSARSHSEPHEATQEVNDSHYQPVDRATRGRIQSFIDETENYPYSWLHYPLGPGYVPQIGDQIIYFAPGHREYHAEHLSDPFPDLSPFQDLGDMIPATVIKLDYLIDAPTRVKVYLQVTQAEGTQVDTFAVIYGESDSPDFLVLRQVVEAALAKSHAVDMCVSQEFLGEESRMERWDGRILEVKEREHYHLWPWKSLKVLWTSVVMAPYGDHEPRPVSIDADFVCPWELYQPEVVVPSLSTSQIDMAIETFASALDAVDNSFVFEEPPEETVKNYYMKIAYPISLETIESKLKGGFYRSLTSLLGDVEFLAKNAQQWNEDRDSDWIIPIGQELVQTLTSMLRDAFQRLETSETGAATRAASKKRKGRPREQEEEEEEEEASVPPIILRVSRRQTTHRQAAETLPAAQATRRMRSTTTESLPARSSLRVGLRQSQKTEETEETEEESEAAGPSSRRRGHPLQEGGDDSLPARQSLRVALRASTADVVAHRSSKRRR